MRIGTYNLNNLFERAAVLELEGFNETSREVLNDVAELSKLLADESYSGTVGTRIHALLMKYFTKKKADGTLTRVENDFFKINEIRNKLFSVSPQNGLLIKPKGRDGWYGWVELLSVPVNSRATQNTARVIDAIDVDVLCTVEVENRHALTSLNNDLLTNPFAHSLLIEGNDDRGIDVGISSRYEILTTTSHVDDFYLGQDGKPYPIFSRDCPEYKLKLPKNKRLIVLVNHLKSKGYGSPAVSNGKRERQAKQIIEILKKYDLKKQLVVVCGDFNDTSSSAPLASLFAYPHLHHINSLIHAQNGGDIGTYLNSKTEDIDHIFASTALKKTFITGAIERRGIWKKAHLNQLDKMFDSVTGTHDQASDHAAVWAEFNI